MLADSSLSARKKWRRFLLIWALILLLLGAAGCFVLYRYLGVYEVTRPEPVLDAYLQNTSADELIQASLQNINLDLTEFEDADTLYRSYLQAVDTNRSLSYRSDAKNGTDEHLSYVVYSGPNALCTLGLTPEGTNPGFGRHVWQVSEVSSAPITDILPSIEVIVDATADTELRLNGKPLSDGYIVERNVAIPDLSRFETVLDPVPSFIRYEIGPLYGEVNLTDAFGRTISPESDQSNGTLHYYASSGAESLTISAPEDIRVFVNGVELSSMDISSSDMGVLQNLDAYAKGESVLTNTYRLEGLYLVPTITGTDPDGNMLTPVISSGDKFTFFHHNDPAVEEILKPVAERFFSAYMEYSAHSWEASRFYNLISRILPGTELYNYVMNSAEAMYWASGTKTEYKDLRYEHFHRVSDYCYTCTVLYSADMTATTWHDQYTYSLENAYELVFVSSGGTWFAAAMNIIADA